jgi:hypothetical protein
MRTQYIPPFVDNYIEIAVAMYGPHGRVLLNPEEEDQQEEEEPNLTVKSEEEKNPDEEEENDESYNCYNSS